MAINSRLTAQRIGFVPPVTTSSFGSTTLSLNAAATWLAYSFVPPIAKTLANVRAYVSSVTGTLAASDLVCSLYTDSAVGGGTIMGPGTLVESHPCTAAPSAAGWYDWTGFATALTAGQQYWLVFSNANASPASNFPVVSYLNAATGMDQIFGGCGTFGGFGWWKTHSTNSGTSWVTRVVSTAGWRVGYSDGSFDGLAISGIADDNASKVCQSNEAGVKFTAPANALLNVIGIAFLADYFNSETASTSATFKLYNGSDRAVVTAPAGPPFATRMGWVAGYFSAPKQLTPGATIRVSMACPAANSSQGHVLIGYTCDPDANSLTLLPFAGTLCKTYSTDGGVTWTDTPGTIYPFALILDVQGEFSAQAGGGGSSGGFIIGGGYGG